MKTLYKVKNFRCFDSIGAEFDIAPITILTGANGAGKSSLVKSLVVLNSYLSKNELTSKYGGPLNHKISIAPSISTPLLFADGELKLGRFDNALNNQNETDKKMTFEYSVDSHSLGCQMTVSLVFCSDESDAMNNGWLSSVTVKNAEGEVVYEAEVEKKEVQVKTLKLSWFKSRFIKAATIACAAECSEWIHADNCIGVDPELGCTEESIKSHRELMDSLRKQVKEKLTMDEKDAFIGWLKTHDEKLVDTKLLDCIGNTIEYGALSLETEFVKSLCGLTTEEAITCIHNIQLDDSFDAAKVDAIKSAIVESLKNTSFKRFQEWYSSEEDNALDRMKLPNIQAINLFKTQTAPVSLFGEEPQQEKTTAKFVVSFEDIVSLLYLTDDNYKEQAMKSPIDMLGCQQTKQYLHVFLNYVSKIALKEVLIPDFANALNYVGSAQVSVQRLYSNQGGNNSFTDLLLKYFNAKRNYVGDYACDSFLNKWIRKFGIGDSITLKNAEGGLGLLALLHKTAGDKGHLLADEGYGITQLLSILLNVELAILTAKTRKSWEGMGYMVRSARANHGVTVYAPQTLAIEEPENHLHPKLQSMLADMFFDAYKNYNIHFVVETHSEYLIRKSQVIVAYQHYESNDDADRKSPFKTYYLPNGDKPYSLGYRKDGKFVNEFGKGFYDEAASLMFEIL